VAYRILLGFGFAAGVASLGGLVNYVAGHSNVPLGLAAGALRRALPPPLHHEWRLVDGKHWQAVALPVESRETTDALEDNRGMCSAGMVQVKGDMKLDYALGPYDPRSIEEMQKTTCKKWINRDYPERCAEFDRDKWLAISSELPTKPMNFCMDRFEYPNQKGEYPVIMANFREAEKLCQTEGKRLCDEAEWTFACEGAEATPYPYGYVRDAEACIVDQKWRPYNGRAMMPRDGPAAMCEMDRLWQGVASGSLPRCRSPFGVYDMTGNVDEWTHSVREGERPSILKGGYWGPVRTRCRPSTRSHDENHAFYQQGFRCCADVGTPATGRPFVADPSAAPLARELK
jgi:hypothetical protein